MAFPGNHSEISTNLSNSELSDIIKAVEEKRITWIPESSYVFGEGAVGEFEYKGALYKLTELFEIVTSLDLIESEQIKLPVA